MPATAAPMGLVRIVPMMSVDCPTTERAVTLKSVGEDKCEAGSACLSCGIEDALSLYTKLVEEEDEAMFDVDAIIGGVRIVGIDPFLAESDDSHTECIAAMCRLLLLSKGMWRKNDEAMGE